MPDQKRLIEDLDYLSETLSKRTREISAGVLLFCWAFLVEGSQKKAGAFIPAPMIAAPVILSILAIMADLCQYLAGLILTQRLLTKSVSEKNSSNIMYNRRNPLYRFRQAMFWGKLVLCLAAATWLIVVLGDATINRVL